MVLKDPRTDSVTGEEDPGSQSDLKMYFWVDKV